MNRKEKIEQEVQKTLDSFDQAERLKKNPFFYTRLKSRIEELEMSRQPKKGWTFNWGVLKPALLVLIVALNIVTVTFYLKNQYRSYTNREELLNAFAQELTLDSSQYNPSLLINE